MRIRGAPLGSQLRGSSLLWRLAAFGTAVLLPARASAAAGRPSKASFAHYLNLSIPPAPLLSAKRLAERRLALQRIVTNSQPANAPWNGCMVLPAYEKCPRSFGNAMHMVLASLMFARLRGSCLVVEAQIHCGGLLRDDSQQSRCRLEELSAAAAAAAHRASGPPQRRAKSYGADAPSTSLASLFRVGAPVGLEPVGLEPIESSRATWPHLSERCLQIAHPHNVAPVHAPHFHAQDASSLRMLRGADGRGDALFGLGPHAAYGALFDAAFTMTNVSRPIVAREGEVLISVHIRHFAAAEKGDEALDAFETAIRFARIRALRDDPSVRQCGLLLASDRRLTLRLFGPIAERLGCRLVISERDDVPVKGWHSAEQGQDTGAVALRDLDLLSHGHTLIGSWGSSLSLLVQDRIAARYGGGGVFPEVRYCDVNFGECGPALPLVTGARDAWHVSFGAWPKVAIVQDAAAAPRAGGRARTPTMSMTLDGRPAPVGR